MKEFGASLHEARKAAHVSFEELYERTKINPKHLRAIEEGDFPSLPQTYIRAFIREYARVVGLDEDVTIERYNALAEAERGIPRPPDAIDHSNILPHLDDTIEIVRSGQKKPSPIEFEGVAEIEKTDFETPVRKIISTGDEHPKPIDIRTTPLSDVERPASDDASTKAEPLLIDETSDFQYTPLIQPAVDEEVLQKKEKRIQISDRHEHKGKPDPKKEKHGVERKSVYDLKPPIPPKKPAEQSSHPRKEKRLNEDERRTLFIGFIVVLIVILGIYGLFFFNNEAPRQTRAVDSTALKANPDMQRKIDSGKAMLSEDFQLQDTGAKPANPSPELKTSFKSVPKDDSLILETYTSSPVWFQIKMDTARSERGNLSSNEHRVWKAKNKFTITLGDAGAAIFFLNGKELGPLGDDGAVLKNLVLTRQNLPQK